MNDKAISVEGFGPVALPSIWAFSFDKLATEKVHNIEIHVVLYGKCMNTIFSHSIEYESTFVNHDLVNQSATTYNVPFFSLYIF